MPIGPRSAMWQPLAGAVLLWVEAQDGGPTGERVALQDGDAIYLEGRGATEDGDRPFLDRLDLTTLEKRRLFRCDESSHEHFLAFVGSSGGSILTQRETKTEPPNIHIVDLKTRERRQLTD
jgi:dipeptidyl aminopeptidase/acylaminoacyl peptidase